jgi:hypothetical protein
MEEKGRRKERKNEGERRRANRKKMQKGTKKRS